MPDEQTPEVAARPENVPEKFWDAEAGAIRTDALLGSYGEAEKALARERNERQREQENFTEALQAFQAEPPRQQQQWSAQTDPTIIAYQRAAEEGDAAAMLAIQMQLADARMAQVLDERFAKLEEKLTPAQKQDQEFALRMAEQQVSAEFGDRWPELAAQINEPLRAVVPTLAGQGVDAYANAIRQQAQLADYQRLQGVQAAADAERQAKLNAQTMTGSTARHVTDTDEKKKEWEQVKDANLGSWSKVVGGG